MSSHWWVSKAPPQVAPDATRISTCDVAGTNPDLNACTRCSGQLVAVLPEVFWKVAVVMNVLDEPVIDTVWVKGEPVAPGCVATTSTLYDPFATSEHAGGPHTFTSPVVEFIWNLLASVPDSESAPAKLGDVGFIVTAAVKTS